MTRHGLRFPRISFSATIRGLRGMRWIWCRSPETARKAVQRPSDDFLPLTHGSLEWTGGALEKREETARSPMPQYLCGSAAFLKSED